MDRILTALIVIGLLFTANHVSAAAKTYQVSVGGKLKDHKGADVGTLSLGESVAAELIKDADTDKEGPGGVARKKIRWNLAKKLAAGGVITLDEGEISDLKDSKICNLPLSLFGPLMDAIGNQ